MYCPGVPSSSTLNEPLRLAKVPSSTIVQRGDWENVLAYCESHQFKSVTSPLLGYQHGRIHPKTLMQTLISTIQEKKPRFPRWFGLELPENLKEIFNEIDF